jgi:hypothetical protein
MQINCSLADLLEMHEESSGEHLMESQGIANMLAWPIPLRNLFGL